MMLDLVQTSWREKRVPKDWSDAVLVPIPKKGDMRKCDNWRGIALLDVVGKVIARDYTREATEVSTGGAT
jgi:hypothetical protein